jgi:hypothetical protein
MSDAFDAVLAELVAMAADSTRRTRSGPKPPLTGAALRKAIMAIWCVCFCGMRGCSVGTLDFTQLFENACSCSSKFYCNH